MKNKSVILLIGGIVLLVTGLVIYFLMSDKSYTVTFDSNGGSVVESQKVKKEEYAKEPSAPTKEKYEFIEWTRDGKTFNFNTIIESDITLVAKWKKTVLDEFEIVIDPKNGKEPSKIKVMENDKLERPADPKYDDYVFIEWQVNGVAYDFDKEVTEAFTIEAKWEKGKCVINFDSNGGSKVENQNLDEGEKVLKPDDPTKEDYTFIEWQLNGKAYDFDTEVTKSITLKAKWKEINYVAYKNSNSFRLNCYEKGTTKTPTILKPGDKIECSLDYEVNAEDKISSIKYNLKYEKGLKLIETKNVTAPKDKSNKYRVNNTKASSLGSAGEFVFEVLNVKDYTDSNNYRITVDNIKFNTGTNNYYLSNSSSLKYTSIWERMSSSIVYSQKGFTLNCVDKNNNTVVSVVKGDVITCNVSLEVESGDEVKYLNYTVGGGSALNRTKVEVSKEITDVGEFHYIASTPTTKINLGKFTYKVVDESQTYMLFVDVYGTFATADGRYLSPTNKKVSFELGNKTKLNSYKEAALNVINTARQDLIVANKLEEGYYYVTTGTTKTSPISGNIKYYKSDCDETIGSLCKSMESLICESTSTSYVKVTKNNNLYSYSVCLTAGGDNAYIDGSEASLLDKNNFSMIKYE